VSAVDRKLITSRGRAGRIQLRRLADGGGRRKRKTVEATVACEECAGRGGAELQLCGEVPWGGGATTRWGARERKSAGGSAESACLVCRRRRSGHVGVRAGNACAGGEHLCGGESVQGTLGCVKGTRGGRRVRSALEWQGGAQTPNGLVVCPTVLGVE